jgi:hypothetical protein
MQRFESSDQKEVSYWEKYSEPTGDLRKDTLYVYGVDYLSSQKLLNYFQYFQPTKVEWLNDTSCNVIFPSEDNALQALNFHCLEKIEDRENFENKKRAALGYQMNDEVIPIYIRFACSGDVKGEDVKAKDSKYYKWSKKNSLRRKDISRRNDRKFKKRNS